MIQESALIIHAAVLGAVKKNEKFWNRKIVVNTYTKGFLWIKHISTQCIR
jgi:hypothetical protein